MMIISLDWRSTMFRNTKVQMAAVLAVGALLGYLAASGKLNPFSVASPPRPPESVANPPRSPEQAVSVKPAKPADDAPCCEGVNKSQFLVRADPKPGNQDQKKDGRKPNIVFIMGDDIGWFQIGAYHRG